MRWVCDESRGSLYLSTGSTIYRGGLYIYPLGLRFIAGGLYIYALGLRFIAGVCTFMPWVYDSSQGSVHSCSGPSIRRRGLYIHALGLQFIAGVCTFMPWAFNSPQGSSSLHTGPAIHLKNHETCMHTYRGPMLAMAT